MQVARKAQYLLQHEHEHVGRHCCYETLWGSEVRGKRSRGRAMASPFQKICRFDIHVKTGGLRFCISTLTPVLKKCVFRHYVFRIRVDSQPKRCNTCAFSQKSVFVWTARKRREKDTLSNPMKPMSN